MLRAFALIGLTLFSSAALANQNKPILVSGAWEAYVYNDAAGKVCYAAARADKLTGGEAKRAGTAISISHRAKSHGEVGLSAPYGFKKDNDAEVLIGGMQYRFFTRGENAWAKGDGADKAIVTAMIKGRDLSVKAMPAKGSTITDTISLKGFSDALSAIDKACGVKR